MAHIGRFYRLHFRRDVLPTRRGHRFGLGVDYFLKLRVTNVFGQNQMLVFGYQPMTLHTEYDEFPIEWRSANFTVSGHTWSMRVRFDRWLFEQQKLLGDFYLTRDGVFSASWMLTVFQDTSAGAWNMDFGRQFPTAWNAAHWPEEPYMAVGTGGTPKKWNGQPVLP